MTTNVPLQITVCGIGELCNYQQARVSHVLSILDPGTPVPTDFLTFGTHERLELRFHDIIDEHPEMVCPRREHIEQMLTFVQQLRHRPHSDTHLLTHCHAGVSRSAASAILVLAELRPELPATALIEELLRIRSRVWPNLRIIEIGDEVLRRRGEIVEAIRRLYGHLLECDPDLNRLMREGGRGREVATAIRPGVNGDTVAFPGQ
jgi:predicted protein tyrosine phosphatase